MFWLFPGDLCDGHSCLHGACIADVTSASRSCHCVDGWMGENCDQQRCHSDVVCLNGGECRCERFESTKNVFADLRSGIHIFSNVGCLCLPGFHGDDCSDTTPSGCDGVTCAHGTCVAGGTCVCEDGYSVDGSGSCTVATCGDVTCGNGAVCVNEECICAEGSHGDLCDGNYSAARLKTHFYKQDVIFRSCVM